MPRMASVGGAGIGSRRARGVGGAAIQISQSGQSRKVAAYVFGAHSRRQTGETDRVPSWAVDRTIVFKRLERGGAVLRRAGLGRLVSAARRVAERRMGRFETVVDGLSLTGVVGLHLQYVEELEAGARED